MPYTQKDFFKKPSYLILIYLLFCKQFCFRSIKKRLSKFSLMALLFGKFSNILAMYLKKKKKSH